MDHDRFLTHLVILIIFPIAMNTRLMQHPNTQKLHVERNEVIYRLL